MAGLLWRFLMRPRIDVVLSMAVPRAPSDRASSSRFPSSVLFAPLSPASWG